MPLLCPLCYNALADAAADVTRLPGCGHTFCSDCLFFAAESAHVVACPRCAAACDVRVPPVAAPPPPPAPTPALEQRVAEQLRDRRGVENLWEGAHPDPQYKTIDLVKHLRSTQIAKSPYFQLAQM
ncbi:hypothetical protein CAUPRSCDRAFT_12977 [Caulochytrium protostelioides]|uniref:RING-type domain-containing protein n=1 Tax=Caulochytrium protostelioides TaxID=1555241 RepID=A0A4P9WVW0_9FUNG|nr:hypothetical protein CAUPRSCDRAFT_12977 [Caulochytrium protostelioides]